MPSVSQRGEVRVQAVAATGDEDERRGALESLHRLVDLLFLRQPASERHLRRVGARVLGGVGAERFDRHPGQRLLVCPTHRTAQGAERPVHRLIETGLELIEIGIERRLQSGIGVETETVRAHEFSQAGVPVGGDEVFDEKRRLVVGD